MQPAKPLLPSIFNEQEYERLRPQQTIWLQAVSEICQRHHIPTDALQRFGDGTDPAVGSTVVFAAGKDVVVKLFPPFQRKAYAAELGVCQLVYGKLSLVTPEIVAHGTLDGWPYLVMSRLQGTYLSDIWDGLQQAEQHALLLQLADVLRQLHALPTYTLTQLDSAWAATIASRVEGCVARHREQGVSAFWLEQIPSFLASAMPLYPTDFKPAIVSADIHQYHLLATPNAGVWQLSGLFDFDDALVGFHEYDLASAGLFLMAGRSHLLRPFFNAYGYADRDINPQLSRRLLAYTLLHRYRPFNWFSVAFAQRPYKTLAELAQIIYDFSTVL